MYDYLVEHGADGEKIIMEDTSSNTWQNICNTLERVKSSGAEGSGQYLLVSNDFHLTRIKMLWDRAWPGTYTVPREPCSLPDQHVFPGTAGAGEILCIRQVIPC